jgi:hypothetical protein
MIRRWIENLGYDLELYPLRSRLFNLVFHSEKSINIDTKDALNNDINYKINNIILLLKGKEAQNDNKENKGLFSSMEYHSLY